MLAVFFHIGHVSGDLSRVLFFTRKFTNVEFFIKEIFLVIVKEDFLFFYFKSPSDLFYRLFIHGSRWLGMIFIECRTSCIDSRQFFLIKNLGSVKKILRLQLPRSWWCSRDDRVLKFLSHSSLAQWKTLSDVFCFLGTGSDDWLCSGLSSSSKIQISCWSA